MKYINAANSARSVAVVSVGGDTVTLTGTSGTANINVSGVTYLATFATSLAVTATNWVLAHREGLSCRGFRCSSLGAVIYIATKRSHIVTNRPVVTIVNITGNLTGTMTAVLTPDFNVCSSYQLIISVPVTIGKALNLRDGQYVRFEITTTGAYDVTWDSSYQFSGGNEPIQTVSGLDVIDGRYTAAADKVYLKQWGEASFSAEYQAVYDAMGELGSYPSGAVLQAQNNLIKYWKSKGVWDDMSFVHVLNTHTNDGGQAQLDWKLPSGGSQQNVSVMENGVAGAYDTFLAVGLDGFNAVKTTGGTKKCGTADEIALTPYKTYRVTYDLVLNSGTLPLYNYLGETIDGAVKSNYVTPVEGANAHILKGTNNTENVVLAFYSTVICDYEVRNLVVKEWRNATLLNNPTFTALEGFTGNASNMALDLNKDLGGIDNFGLNDCSLFFYNRKDVNEDAAELGVTVGGDYTLMNARKDNLFRVFMNTAHLFDSFASTDARGMFFGSRTGANFYEGWKNKTKQIEATDVSSAIPTGHNIYGLSYNNTGSITGPSSKQLSLIAGGKGLTQVKVDYIYDGFQAYMTALEKQV